MKKMNMVNYMRQIGCIDWRDEVPQKRGYS